MTSIIIVYMSWTLLDKWYHDFNRSVLPDTISWYGRGGIKFGNYELMPKEDKFSRPIVLGYPWHWHFLNVPLDYHLIYRLWSCSCRGKTTVFLSVLIKFKLFKTPYYFIGVLPCPGHGIGTQRLIFDASLVAKWLHIWNAFVCNLKYKNVCIFISVGSILIF